MLSHQAIIDSTWQEGIKPLLLTHFPEADSAQLAEARSYAYGGCIIQDMGYYPLSRKLFTNLTHHVRSGDFVLNMIKEAHTLNEMGFALGALAHYYADVLGHPLGTNRAVAHLFPKKDLNADGSLNYGENPLSHKQTELAFDVYFLAEGEFAPVHYHNALGFRVEKDLLERSFEKTYGVSVGRLFFNFSLAVGTYRKTVSLLLPELVNIVWVTKRNLLKASKAEIKKSKKEQKQLNEAYAVQSKGKYEQPGIAAHLVGFIFRYLPKIGPFRMFALRVPDQVAEKMFRESFSQTTTAYTKALQVLRNNQEPALPNIDFDTGKLLTDEDYDIAEQTYRKLLRQLDRNDYKMLSPSLQEHLVQHYKSYETMNSKTVTKRTKKRIAEIKKRVLQ